MNKKNYKIYKYIFIWTPPKLNFFLDWKKKYIYYKQLQKINEKSLPTRNKFVGPHQKKKPFDPLKKFKKFKIYIYNWEPPKTYFFNPPHKIICLAPLQKKIKKKKDPPSQKKIYPSQKKKIIPPFNIFFGPPLPPKQHKLFTPSKKKL